MSKEYTQALDDLFGLVAFQKSLTKEQFRRAQKHFEILESALQRLEAIDKAVEICKDAKNKAESFELILFKNVDLNLIRHSASAESYNSKIPYYRVNLTNDEFTFLKEIIRQSLLQRIEVEE